VRRYITKRALWTVFAAYLLLSAVFLVFAYTPDPNQKTAGLLNAMGGGDYQNGANQYAKARGYDKPILDRYVDWVVSYTTLDWGTTLEGKPVIDVLADAIPLTLVYLIPAIVLSTLLGTFIGLYSAVHKHGYVDKIVTAITYPSMGLPAFWIASWSATIVLERISVQAGMFDDRYGLWTSQNLPYMLLPIFVVTINLLTIQIRYTRSTTMEYVPAEFVKTLRANGATARDVSRHVLRNASLPLISVFFAETLTMLFVTILVVEYTFGIRGFGLIAFNAIQARDPALILATTMIPILIGLAGNFVQDVAYALLDPRIDYQ